jgi:hypothetical protein
MMTECIAPPGPDDVALIAYKDDDSDVSTIEHLRLCAHCRARAGTLARQTRQLSQFLYRAKCLSTDALQDYHFGFLSAQQMADCTAHLQSCPHCTRELAMLARFMVSDAEELAGVAPSFASLEPSREGGLLQRIQTVVATWLQGGPAGLTPAYAGLRGGDSNQQLFGAGDFQIGIDIHLSVEHPGQRELIGSLLGYESTDLLDSAEAATPVWQAHLWQAGRLVGVAPLQELGDFVFANLIPAVYELNIVGPGIAICIDTVAVP